MFSLTGIKSTSNAVKNKGGKLSHTQPNSAMPSFQKLNCSKDVILETDDDMNQSQKNSSPKLQNMKSQASAN